MCLLQLLLVLSVIMNVYFSIFYVVHQFYTLL